MDAFSDAPIPIKGSGLSSIDGFSLFRMPSNNVLPALSMLRPYQLTKGELIGWDAAKLDYPSSIA
jgi:hypothetical protein